MTHLLILLKFKQKAKSIFHRSQRSEEYGIAGFAASITACPPTVGIPYPQAPSSPSGVYHAVAGMEYYVCPMSFYL